MSVTTNPKASLTVEDVESRASLDSLTSEISNETDQRISAVSSLQSSINSEITARQNADATLQTTVDSKEPAIAAGAASQYWTGLKDWATLSWSAIQSIPDALSQIVGLNPTDDDVLQRKSGGWVNRTIAQLKLDIGIGTTADKINNLCQLYMLENLIGIPTYMSSFNEPWFLQNNLSQHTVRILQANGLGGTTFSQLGLSAYTTFGTTTGVATAQGSEWLQLTRCAMAVSGLNTIAGWYTTALTHYYPAASINFGHVMSIGFGVRDSAGGALIPDARMFVGETTSITNPTNIDPKTMTNAIGVIQSTTLPNPNNLYFYVNGSSAAGYLFDTGMAVSLTTGYRLTIFNIKGTRKVLMRLSDINTDAAVNHFVDIDLLPANQQPLSTAGYGTRLWRASANNTIGTPLQIVLSKIYLEGKN